MDLHFTPEPWVASCPCDVDTTSPVELTAVTLAATQLVDALTGHQFGLSTVTLRPCRRSCLPYAPGWSAWGAPGRGATLRGWYWLTDECAVCSVGCSCGVLPQVELPYPVHDVLSVKVDGSPLVTGAYRVDSNRFLVRLDGAHWPACNNLLLADTQVGTWSVTARFGQDPPELGRRAVGEMACELLKGFAGEACGLPSNVVQLARQGVTMKFSDVAGNFGDGRTGLFLVDAFIEAVNPHGLRRRPRVFDVDEIAGRRAGT